MPFSDRKPSDIEAITDIFVEDFLNFPTTQENTLGGVSDVDFRSELPSSFLQ